MKTTPPRSFHPDNRMRYGYLVTGLGLFGCLAAVALLLHSAGGSLALCVMLLCAGLIVTTAGFAMMVVAADPLQDDEVDRSDVKPST